MDRKEAGVLRNIYFILFIVILLLGCDAFIPESGEIEREKIFGRYVANYGEFGKFIEYIDLRPDTTYIHYYKHNNIEYIDTGFWDFHCDTYEIMSNINKDSIKSMPKEYPPAYIPSQYEIVLYGFIRRHIRDNLGYDSGGRIDSTTHIWMTFLYRYPSSEDIWLEYCPDVGQGYLRQAEDSILY